MIQKGVVEMKRMWALRWGGEQRGDHTVYYWNGAGIGEVSEPIKRFRTENEAWKYIARTWDHPYWPEWKPVLLEGRGNNLHEMEVGG